ncbi:hypothetical protein SNOG_15129 [Parastagonospora nodorum SN15]|uniref:Uncharacterized protein n=1 Tax=Phaeosphaeria nodorum (strain SN15 / ATCC MYA-4574 / FGSC 10173) TaxID=321614 RepID=Q0TYZ6_PHANO|nr:hypothetical protein SNOG_15129 [Parastagonospora nodorum SN15]EAT77354.1 hypothetical protein SNOG_15129 [Parastagonospora nodorum SN15]
MEAKTLSTVMFTKPILDATSNSDSSVAAIAKTH